MKIWRKLLIISAYLFIGILIIIGAFGIYRNWDESTRETRKYREWKQALDAKSDYIKSLVDEYCELGKKGNLTVEEYNRFKEIEGELELLVPRFKEIKAQYIRER